MHNGFIMLKAKHTTITEQLKKNQNHLYDMGGGGAGWGGGVPNSVFNKKNSCLFVIR